MVLRPVSGHCIEQDIAHMNLIGIKVKSPDRPVVLNEESDVRNRPSWTDSCSNANSSSSPATATA